MDNLLQAFIVAAQHMDINVPHDKYEYIEKDAYTFLKKMFMQLPNAYKEGL